MSSSAQKTWEPAKFLPEDKKRPEFYYALIVLNTPIENADVFNHLYDGATYVVCADGGANRLREFGQREHTKSAKKGRPRAKAKISRSGPNAIVGDMDSLKLDVEKYYRESGVTIIKESDQDSTDFMKCLKHVRKITERATQPANGEEENLEWEMSTSNYDIVVMGGLGGRTDQAFSQLHQLYAAADSSEITNNDIYLITPESINFILPNGTHKIMTPVVNYLGDSVGIIPLGRPAVITTRGLEWDVKDWATEFGGNMSTSNHVMNPFVEVQTTEKVLFTIEILKGQEGGRYRDEAEPAMVNED